MTGQGGSHPFQFVAVDWVDLPGVGSCVEVWRSKVLQAGLVVRITEFEGVLFVRKLQS